MAHVRTTRTKGSRDSSESGESSQGDRAWLRRVYEMLDGPEVTVPRSDPVGSRSESAKPALKIGLAAAFSGAIIVVITPMVSLRIVDRSIIGRDGQLTKWLWIFGGLAVLRSIFTFMRRIFVGNVSIQFETNARLAVHDRLRTLDRVALDRFPPGQVVSRANGDISSVSQVLSFTPFVLANALQVVLSFVAMVRLSWRLSSVVFVMIPLIIAIAKPARRLQFAASLDVQQRQGAMAAFADESISGVRVIKGFGRERDVTSRFESFGRELYGSRLRNVRIGARITPLLQLVPQLAVVILLLWGGRMTIDKKLSVGTFIAFATYLSQLVSPLRTSAIMFTVLQTARAGATRVFELLDAKSEISDAPFATVMADASIAAVSPRIEIEHLTVRFGQVAVLTDVSLTVSPGETIALVGRSGSGKSTLALTLARFAEAAGGAINLDGVDLRAHTIESVRTNIGLVFDDSFLFSRSVRENIALGRPDATDSEIRYAARMAAAEEFIDALPLGLDTVVGEQGLTLSGGQRQRLSLARALLVNPPVLVLDDATSALDVLTESTVHENLRAVRRGLTTVIVAQRRTSLALVDRIVFLEAGRVLDVGTAAELEARCPEFVSLLEEHRPGPEDELPGFVSHGTAFGAQASAGPMRPGMGGGGFPVPTTGSAFAAAIGDDAKLPDVRDEPPEVAINAVQSALTDTSRWSIWPSLLKQRWLLVVAGLLLLGEAASSVISPAFVKRGLNDGVAKASRSALDRNVIWFFGALLVALVIAYFSALVVGLLGERMLYRLRLRVFAHLQNLGLDFYERELSGRLLTRVTSDVDALGNVLQQGVVSLVVNVVTFVVLAIFLLRANLRLGLLLILTFPPLVLATLRFRTVSGRSYEQVRDRVAIVNAELAETFGGVRVVQSLGGRDRSGERYASAVARHREARMTAQRQTSLYFPFVEFVSAFAVLIVLWAGSSLVQNGSLNVGALTAFLLSVTLLFGPVQQLSVVLDTWQQAGAALAKLRALFEQNPSVTDAAASSSLNTHTVGSPTIEFRNVTFRYNGAPRDAVEKINLTIKSGETVALVGSTGAGKSTVMKLVPRFYEPTEGQVLIDGVDLRTIPLGAWRSRIGIVVQESVLFTGTIADNVSFAKPTATRDEIEAALQLVGATSLLNAPQGIDTPVMRRGSSLSAGQRQLVALARAALVNPDVLLLDEATANLDLETEADVLRAMGVLASNRTTVVIAHRLETARRADRIVVIEGGRIVESGPHDELLRSGGRYADLWFASHLPG
jgi:ATP-binding cassette, subfamily B, bacterial